MTATVKHSNPNALKQVYERLGSASKREVAVGFPAGMANAYPDGTPVAQVAAWNVYGTENIPSRDFMGLARADIIRDQHTVVNKIKARRKPLSEEGVDMMLATLGHLAQKDIQKAIVDLDSPPNKPSTIKAKGSSNPLIDTGHMLQSVTFIVRDTE